MVTGAGETTTVTTAEETAADHFPPLPVLSFCRLDVFQVQKQGHLPPNVSYILNVRLQLCFDNG